MAVSTSVLYKDGALSAFQQTADGSIAQANASSSAKSSNTLSGTINNKINYSIEQKRNQLDFFFDKIIILDGEKIDEDLAITRMDTSILADIEAVNVKLRALQTAYQNRVSAGVKSDLIWRITSYTTSTSSQVIVSSGSTIGTTVFTYTGTYSLRCVRTSAGGLPQIGGSTNISYITSSGTASASTNDFPPFGYIADNLHGLKYYDEPYSTDILDTFVGSFTGSIGAASTVLTVRQLSSSGVASRIKVGQNIICSKEGVFPAGNEIVAIGSTIVNLDPTVEKIQATATAVSVGGTVSEIFITNSGAGYTYTSPPTISIDAPFGNRATGTATVSAAGTISEITLVNAGSGYTFAPTVTISSPVVISAAGYGLTNAAGIITDVVITDGGSGYSTTPTVVFEDPPSGTTATGTANLGVGNTVISVTITNAGSGYVSNPPVLFSTPGFTTATASASVSSGSVDSVIIINPGAGYTSASPPTVTFSSPPVVGASATVTISDVGIVTAITITNPGVGYTSTPSVTIEPPFNDLVPILYLEQGAADSASYPESDGSFVTFTVLSTSEEIDSIASETIALEFGANPFSPQTIGIMATSQAGIGTFIKYDNSGASSVTQTWRPELAAPEIRSGGTVYAAAVVEPTVGSGKIYYNNGFSVKPRYPTNGSYTSWRDAVEGDTLTLIYKSGYFFGTNPPPLTSFVTATSSDTGGYGTAITNAQNEVNSAEAEIAASLSSLNQKISVSNVLRKEKNEIAIQIWSQRQLIGQLLNEIAQYESSKSSLDSSTIRNIINGN